MNSMKNIAIFPGSFDPITVGHVSIIKRALPLFGQVIIAIGMNIEKKTMRKRDIKCLDEACRIAGNVFN